jgi:sugar transferase (PEP-CTERM/EpsH1 system associated)
MNILFLCHRLPFPPNKGDKIRSHALFRHLASKHTVHLGCFVDDLADAAYIEQVREMAGGSCVFVPLTKQRKLLRSAAAFVSRTSISEAVYRDAGIDRWLDSIVRSFDIDAAIVFGSSMAPYLTRGGKVDPNRVLFDMVDLDSDKWQQYANTKTLTSWVYRREARMLLKLERLAAATFAQTYLVSPFEAQSFRSLAPESSDSIRALCNGVDFDYFSPGNYRSPFPSHVEPIVMTGRMDYWPNVEGAIWFAKEVLPLIKLAIPSAKFYVVGASPTTALQSISNADVEVTGEVADIRPYIASARVSVAPLRIARGVQNKVLEAFAMQVPTVATEEASRALSARPGIDLWVANSAREFGAAVVSAACGEHRSGVAANGRLYVVNNHNWSKLFASVDDQLETFFARRINSAASHWPPQSDVLESSRCQEKAGVHE